MQKRILYVSCFLSVLFLIQDFLRSWDELAIYLRRSKVIYMLWCCIAVYNTQQHNTIVLGMI